MQTLGLALAVGAAGASGIASKAAKAGDTLPAGAKTLADFTKRLAAAPRRRDFKTVPMILDHPDQWDDAALKEVLAYKSVSKQCWDNTDIHGSWLNVMRNSLNAQVYSFGHADFLIVSATHGSANYALYDQMIWDKYSLAKMVGGKPAKNELILDKKGASANPADYQNPAGVYSPENISIPALMRRGAVFMSCHNAVWEQARKLHAKGFNPDKLSVDEIAADLTNHLIKDVVLIPGAVATLVELENAGFRYAR
ncbi:hypothetical protein K6118_02145 [Kordiimonas sp. A6E486]|nr:hypothetical protein [Kordiimonas marina]MCJ9427864.1 hypothetical protein [Kordiimonas marina]